MKHLSDEQFEELLSGEKADDVHLRECEQCRRRLSDMRALRSRLRSAFSSVAPPAGLAGRMRDLIAKQQEASGSARKAPVYFRIWPALAAAAAIMIVAVPLFYFLGQPGSATAATAELARIHTANVAGTDGFHRESDPDKLIAYLSGEGCRGPAKPRLCQHCASLTGCNVAQFHGRKVATYCMNTPGGSVSIIIVEDEPESLGLSRTAERNKLKVLLGSYDRANVAAVRSGGLTYCAIGQISHEALADLLTWAIPTAATQATDAAGCVCPFCGGRS
ncbi:MAG: anti-sigma factor family protein [Planctomycetota bacterium]|jgi:hypothetical protein